jgi:hypothetical protein
MAGPPVCAGGSASKNRALARFFFGAPDRAQAMSKEVGSLERQRQARKLGRDQRLLFGRIASLLLIEGGLARVRFA